MSLIIYGYHKCSTCLNALRFLEQHKIPFVSKEITQTPPSISELEAMLQFVGDDIKKICNTSGILYREMNLSQKLPLMNRQQILELLSQNGMLIKRPFVLGNNFGLLGFKEEKWNSILNKA